jgi:hypothetical protein
LVEILRTELSAMKNACRAAVSTLARRVLILEALVVYCQAVGVTVSLCNLIS